MLTSRCKKLLPVLILVSLFMLMPKTALAGSVSGSILDPDDNLVEDTVRVEISADLEEWLEQIIDDGTYRFEDLPENYYFLRAQDLEEDTWYLRVYYPGVWNGEDAEWVMVLEDDEVNNIDITLCYGGKISGSVTPADDGEFDEWGILLELADEIDGWFTPVHWFTLETPSDYISELIPPGDYIVRFSSLEQEDMHVQTFFGDTWDGQNAEWFTVSEQQATEEISVELPLGGGVTGRITAEGRTLDGSMIFVIVPGTSPFSYMMPFKYGMAEEEGVYTIRGIPEGECYLQFHPSFPVYAREWYDGVYSMHLASAVDINPDELTSNINADVERGTVLRGTIRTPEGNAPQSGSVNIEGIDAFGREEYLEIEWSDDGSWSTLTGVIPGIQTLKIAPGWMDNNWAQTYLNGSIFAWDADWMYLGPNAGAGPFNIELAYGGTVEGRVVDPNDDPVDNLYVSLYYDDNEYMDTETFEDGSYCFTGVPAGDYKLMAQLNLNNNGEEEEVYDEIDMDRLFPVICNGGGLQINLAECFAVTEAETVNVDLQFVEGGLLHADITNPDGEYYDLFEDNTGVACFPIREDGLVFWDIVSVPSDPPFVEEEGVYMILPPGTFTIVGFPICFSFKSEDETDGVRRTFLGGGFTANNAETFEITAGEVTEVEMEMVEEGHTVTGFTATRNGDPFNAFNMLVSLVDSDGLVVAVYFPYFDLLGNGSFFIKEVPNGEYYLMVASDFETYAVSTFYPDLAVPGRFIEDVEIPDGATAITVEGEDIENLQFTIQTAESFASVPRKNSRFSLPVGYKLHGIYPNPFNNAACISFTLPTSSRVSLMLYDLLGRKAAEIKTGRYSPGTHHVLLEAKDLAAGVYFVRMKAGNFEAARKVVLVK